MGIGVETGKNIQTTKEEETKLIRINIS